MDMSTVTGAARWTERVLGTHIGAFVSYNFSLILLKWQTCTAFWASSDFKFTIPCVLIRLK